MRGYIFTSQEREILQRYLKDGIKLEGFLVLAFRIRKAKDTVTQDQAMLQQVLDKISSEKPTKEEDEDYPGAIMERLRKQ